MKYVLILRNGKYVIEQHNLKPIGRGCYKDNRGRVHGGEFVFNNMITASIKKEKLNGTTSKRAC